MKLPNGREIYANNNIIGIDDEFNLFQGFDGSLGEMEEDLTYEDMSEIADIMIDRWTKFKEKIND